MESPDQDPPQIFVCLNKEVLNVSSQPPRASQLHGHEHEVNRGERRLQAYIKDPDRHMHHCMLLM